MQRRFPSVKKKGYSIVSVTCRDRWFEVNLCQVRVVFTPRVYPNRRKPTLYSAFEDVQREATCLSLRLLLNTFAWPSNIYRIAESAAGETRPCDAFLKQFTYDKAKLSANEICLHQLAIFLQMRGIPYFWNRMQCVCVCVCMYTCAWLCCRCIFTLLHFSY